MQVGKRPYKELVVFVPSRPAGEPDLALMAAVAAKDGGAQAVLVERLAGRVRRIAGLLSRSIADADDAAQATLLEILGSAQNFSRPNNLERWADRITVRTTLRQARRERQRRGYLARWLEPGTFPWGRSGASDDSDRVSVDDLLERLSDNRREAFVMRHALGFTVQEIAELTGSRVGTVKDRLVASRKQLRALLRREARRLGRGGQP